MPDAYLNTQLLAPLYSFSFKNGFLLPFRDWTLVKERVRSHPDFEHFFVEYPEDTTWMEAEVFGDNSGRIPYQILEMPDAETVFKNHLNQMHAQQKILE